MYIEEIKDDKLLVSNKLMNNSNLDFIFMKYIILYVHKEIEEMKDDIR